jgi:hypothetical protein
LREILCQQFRNPAPAKKVVGDGEEYVIVSGSEKAATKSFIDVAVKIGGRDKMVARYALILIGISGQRSHRIRRPQRLQ